MVVGDSTLVCHEKRYFVAPLLAQPVGSLLGVRANWFVEHRIYDPKICEQAVYLEACDVAYML